MLVAGGCECLSTLSRKAQVRVKTAGNGKIADEALERASLSTEGETSRDVYMHR